MTATITWLVLSFGCSLEMLNLWWMLTVNLRDITRFPKAIPVVPIAINVYAVLHFDTSFVVKSLSIAGAFILEFLTLIVVPRLYWHRWNGSTLLHKAASKGDRLVVEALIRDGADVNPRNKEEWSPVELAAIRGHAEVVDLLAHAGAQLERYNASAWGDARLDVLGLAAAYGQTDSVKVLLERGQPINDENGIGSSALCAAVRSRRVEMVEYLLNNGARLGPSAVSGLTPVHEAADRGYFELLLIMLEHGADLNMSDRWGRTTLAYVRELRRNRRVIRWLIEHGARD